MKKALHNTKNYMKKIKTLLFKKKWLSLTIVGAVGIAIVAITVPLVLKNNDKDIDKDDKSVEFDFSHDLAKFVDSNSTFLKSHLKTSVDGKNVGSAITLVDLGHTLPTALSTGVTATYKVKTPYNDTTGKIVITVILSHGIADSLETASKDFTISPKTPFDFTADLDGINENYYGPEQSVKDHSKNLTAGDKVSISEWQLTYPINLSTGVTATYKVKTPYNDTTGKIVITATLSHGIADSLETASKDFAIGWGFDFTTYLDKIADKNYGVSRQSMEIFIRDYRIGAGSKISFLSKLRLKYPINLWNQNGVTVTYKVKTPYNDITGILVVTATLSHGKGDSLKTVTKDFTIEAKYDFSNILKNYGNQIRNKGATRYVLRTRLGGKKVGEIVTLGKMYTPGNGYNLSYDLPTGVTATYKVKTPYDNTTGKMGITVTLSYGTGNHIETATKDFTLLAKDDSVYFTEMLGKFINTSSSLTTSILKDNVGGKSIGDPVTSAELGYTTPQTDATRVTYKVKTPYDDTTGKIVITVTLFAREGIKMEVATKDFTIKGKMDLTQELARIPDEIYVYSTSPRLEYLMPKNVGDSALTSRVNSLFLAKDQIQISKEGVSLNLKVKTLYDDTTGKMGITVTLSFGTGITYSKVSKDITIIELYDFSSSLDNFVNSNSWFNKEDLKTNVGSKNTDDPVTSAELGYTWPRVGSGVTATYKVKTPYDDTTGKIAITVTLTHATLHSAASGVVSATKDFTISPKAPFDFTKSLANIPNLNYVDSKLRMKNLAEDLKEGDNVPLNPSATQWRIRNRITIQRSIQDPNRFKGIVLPRGVTATYKVKTPYNDITGILVVTANLSHGTGDYIETATKDFTIEGKARFSDFKTLIHDAVSDLSKHVLKVNVGSKNIGDSVTLADLGYDIYFNQTDYLRVSFKIKTPYDDTTGKVVVTGMASSGSGNTLETTTKDFTVSSPAPFDFTSDLAKFIDSTSSFSKQILRENVGDKNTGDSITLAESGYTQPTGLATGVTATYKVKTPYDDTVGKIVVTVTLSRGGGDKWEIATKDFDIWGVPSLSFDFKTNLDKITNAESSLSRYILKANVGSKNIGDTITLLELGYVLQTSLSTGVTATYKVKTSYDNTTGKIIITATLSHGSGSSLDTIDKDFTVSSPAPFDFTSDLAKFTNELSSLYALNLKTNVGDKNTDDPITLAELGYTQPTGLATGVTATYKVKTPYDNSTKKVVITVTLSHGSGNKLERVEKNIILTGKFDFTADFVQYKDVVIEQGWSLKSTLGHKRAGESITYYQEFHADNSGWRHNPLLIATFVVKTPYDDTTRKMVITVTLTFGTRSSDEQTASKDFVIEDIYDFTADIAKVIDAASSFSRSEALLMRNLLPNQGSSYNVLSAKNLGYIPPAGLSEGTKITSFTVEDYQITNVFGKSYVIVKYKITHGLSHKFVRGLKISFLDSPFDFATDLDKFINETSSWGKLDLKTNVGSKVTNDIVTLAELGYTQPADLSAGVTATYAVKTPYDDTTGKIVVTVFLHHGSGSTLETATKDITISFVDLAIEAAKFVDKESYLLFRDEFKSLVFGKVNVNDEFTFVSLTDLGYRLPKMNPGLKYVFKIKTPYDNTTGKIVFTVIMSSGTGASLQTITKDFSLKGFEHFNFRSDITKFDHGLSSLLKSEFESNINRKKTGDIVTPAELGFTEPTDLSPGVTVTYSVFVPYNSSVISITVTLSHGTGNKYETASKEIIIRPTPPFDFTADLAKFTDATSLFSKSSLKASVGSKGIGENVTAAELGFTEPTDLSPGVLATYKVKTPFDETTGIIVITVILNHIEENARYIEVKAKDFALNTN